jgi:hypothetical protein
MKSFLGYLPDFDLPDENPGPKPDAIPATQLIRRALRAHPRYLTAASLAARAGLTVAKVHSTLDVLRRRDRKSSVGSTGTRVSGIAARATPGGTVALKEILVTRSRAGILPERVTIGHHGCVAWLVTMKGARR